MGSILHTKSVRCKEIHDVDRASIFTDTYWIIPLHANIPYGKVSFTRQEARLFRAMFKDSRLIWAGRQPMHEDIEKISTPQGRVNIPLPSTITEIVTVQGVTHV